MRNKDLALNWQEWYRNFRADVIARLKSETETLEMKFTLATQSGAEGIMRNVAKRMMKGDLARVVIAWHQGLLEMRSQQRGENIMRRVGGRWQNREVSDAVREWRDQHRAEKAKLRAEGIMRRVG